MGTYVVTGASSGIGRAAAQELVREGHEVVGLARRAAAMPGGVEPVGVDLAEPEAVARAAAGLRQRRVDGFVHCAGYGDFAPVELTAASDVRRQLQVNVVSAAELIAALLPGMRAVGAGRIVLVSSVAAAFSSPCAAWYHASKAALEAMADALRVEVADQGVAVSLLEPAVVRTQWHEVALRRLAEVSDGTAYESLGRATADYHRRSAAGAGVAEVEDVTAAIVRALHDPRPRPRYRVGRGAGLAMALPRLLPDRTWDALLRRQFGLGA